jgi:hypothetical protein
MTRVAATAKGGTGPMSDLAQEFYQGLCGRVKADGPMHEADA